MIIFSKLFNTLDISDMKIKEWRVSKCVWSIVLISSVQFTMLLFGFFFIIDVKFESLSWWVFAEVCESFGFSLSIRCCCLAAAIDQNERTGSWCPSLTALADIPESWTRDSVIYSIFCCTERINSRVSTMCVVFTHWKNRLCPSETDSLPLMGN